MIIENRVGVLMFVEEMTNDEVIWMIIGYRMRLIERNRVLGFQPSIFFSE